MVGTIWLPSTASAGRPASVSSAQLRACSRFCQVTPRGMRMPTARSNSAVGSAPGQASSMASSLRFKEAAESGLQLLQPSLHPPLFFPPVLIVCREQVLLPVQRGGRRASYKHLVPHLNKI